LINLFCFLEVECGAQQLTLVPQVEGERAPSFLYVRSPQKLRSQEFGLRSDHLSCVPCS
jgi:hypothetical protein